MVRIKVNLKTIFLWLLLLAQLGGAFLFLRYWYRSDKFPYYIDNYISKLPANVKGHSVFEKAVTRGRGAMPIDPRLSFVETYFVKKYAGIVTNVKREKGQFVINMKLSKDENVSVRVPESTAHICLKDKCGADVVDKLDFRKSYYSSLFVYDEFNNGGGDMQQSSYLFMNSEE